MTVSKAGHGVAAVVILSGGFTRMMTIPYPSRAVVRWGLAAAAIFALSAAQGQRAEALSLINPGAASAAQHVSGGLTTEVRDGHGGGGFRGGGGGFRGGGGFHGSFRGGGTAFHGGGFRGGGAAFRGGGFRSGSAAFRGGGFRAGHVFRGGGFRAAHLHRGGGYRYGGYYHRGHRFAHRRHFHSRFYGYGRSYYYPHRYCRVIWTYYGPRKICRYRPWYHHHWRHRGFRVPLY
jgi:hypothetical protein